MAKYFKHHIVDSQGNHIESHIAGDLEQAQSVLRFLEQSLNRYDLKLISEHVPQMGGHILGRDPDLH